MTEQDDLFLKAIEAGRKKWKYFPDKAFHEAEAKLKNVGSAANRVDVLEVVLKDLLIMFVTMNDYYKIMFEAINLIFKKYGQKHIKVETLLEPVFKIQREMEEKFLDELMDSVPKDAKKS